MSNLNWNFQGSSKQEWLEKASSEMKEGKPSDLIIQTEDGFIIEPYYVRDDLENIHFQKNKFYSKYRGEAGIINFYSVYGSDSGSLNKDLLNALKMGANGVRISTPVQNEKFLQESLDQVVRELVYFDFCCTKGSENLVKTLTGNIDSIPKGSLSFLPDPEHLKTMIEWSENKPDFFPLTISDEEVTGGLSGRNALMLSHFASVIESLDSLSLSPESSMNKIRFVFPIGLNYFLEAARVRSFAMVLDEVLSLYATRHKPTVIFHGECYPWNNTTYEPHENMIRGTSGTLSAIVGGCNSLSVLPSDPRDALQRRVAWNTFHVLKYEGLIDKVEDPGRGAYYFENLTYQLAEKTLDMFKELEAKGGWSESSKNSKS